MTGWRRSSVVAALAMAAVAQADPPAGQAADDAERIAAGWAALRTMDCARCHGRDYDGWAAPSLNAAVRDGNRERFDRMVLDGDIPRGMPGYRSQPKVVSELDAIYAYLAARAAGRMGAGPPASAASGAPGR
jgi:mono/diheme cytochrome c family protein